MREKECDELDNKPCRPFNLRLTLLPHSLYNTMEEEPHVRLLKPVPFLFNNSFLTDFQHFDTISHIGSGQAANNRKVQTPS